MGSGRPQACRDFLGAAEAHSRRWQRALQYEQEQRVRLEETIEQLAKQHNSLERAFRSSTSTRGSGPSFEGEAAGKRGAGRGAARTGETGGLRPQPAPSRKPLDTRGGGQRGR